MRILSAESVDEVKLSLAAFYLGAFFRAKLFRICPSISDDLPLDSVCGCSFRPAAVFFRDVHVLSTDGVFDEIRPPTPQKGPTERTTGLSRRL